MDQQTALADVHRQIIERFPMYQTHPAFEHWLLEKGGADPRTTSRYLDLVEDYGMMGPGGMLDQAYTQLPEPEAVAGDIERRLGGLPDQTLEALKIAAIEGKHFSADVVAALAEVSGSEVESRLAAAERSGVIARDGTEQLYAGGASTRYRFVPLGTQDYLYQRIPQEELNRLHPALVEFLSDALAKATDPGAQELLAGMIDLHNSRLTRPSPSPAKP